MVITGTGMQEKDIRSAAEIFGLPDCMGQIFGSEFFQSGSSSRRNSASVRKQASREDKQMGIYIGRLDAV